MIQISRNRCRAIASADTPDVLSLDAAAAMQLPADHNGTVRLHGVNNSAGRSVSLPVVCTPTLLTLETPEFQSVWKRPGKYSSKLTITFTPSSASL
ncbi:CfaE/CblD family pilus tip adhesin [Burkholderia aenigmatica]|uniref:CfaE/CblD family pilus tip adhesin n=1 Tax=Burkholderia aenigmatica TaxID=2015348 RepID=UPI003455EA74